MSIILCKNGFQTYIYVNFYLVFTSIVTCQNAKITIPPVTPCIYKQVFMNDWNIEVYTYIFSLE